MLPTFQWNLPFVLGHYTQRRATSLSLRGVNICCSRETSGFVRDISGGQSPFCNLVFAHEEDTSLRLRVPNEILKEFCPSWNAGDAVVCADRHHPSPVHGLSVENFEVVS